LPYEIRGIARRMKMVNVVEWLKEDWSLTTRLPADRKHRYAYDPENGYHKALRMIVCTAISLIGLYLTWEVAAILIDKTVVPTPEATWEALKDFAVNGDAAAGGTMTDYIWASLGTLLKGFFLALIVAYPLGLLLGTSKTLRDLVSPALNVLRPIAPVAWAPVLVILLQSGASGAMIVVFIGVFFPLLTSVVFGVTKTDRNWIDATRTLGASKLQSFKLVTVPGSIPYLMNGIKTGIGIGWMCIVSAELYASSVGGLGNYITNQAGLGAWPYVFAGIVIIGILGLITVSVVEIASRYVDKRWGFAE